MSTFYEQHKYELPTANLEDLLKELLQVAGVVKESTPKPKTVSDYTQARIDFLSRFQSNLADLLKSSAVGASPRLREVVTQVLSTSADYMTGVEWAWNNATSEFGVQDGLRDVFEQVDKIKKQFSHDEVLNSFVVTWASMLLTPQNLYKHMLHAAPESATTKAEVEFEKARNEFFRKLQANYGDLLAASAPDTSFKMRQAVSCTLQTTQNYLEGVEFVWESGHSLDEVKGHLDHVMEDISIILKDYSPYGGHIDQFLQAWSELFLTPKQLFNHINSCKDAANG